MHVHVGSQPLYSNAKCFIRHISFPPAEYDVAITRSSPSFKAVCIQISWFSCKRCGVTWVFLICIFGLAHCRCFSWLAGRGKKARRLITSSPLIPLICPEEERASSANWGRSAGASHNGVGVGVIEGNLMSCTLWASLMKIYQLKKIFYYIIVSTLIIRPST